MEQNILIGITSFLLIIEFINGQITLTVPAEGYVGQSINLLCKQAGFDDALGYSWFKDNTISLYDQNGVIAAGTSSKYNGSDDADGFYLTINNLTVSDEGVYHCAANFDVALTQSLSIIGKAQVPDDAEITSGKLIITFTEIYPDTTTVISVMCDSTNIPGSLGTTNSSGSGLFDATWVSTSVFPDSVNQAAECTATLQGYNISYDVIFSIKDPCEITVWDIMLLILVIIVAAAIIVIAYLLYNAKTVGNYIVCIVSGILALDVGIIVNIIVCVVTLEPNCSLSICAILGIVIGLIDVVASIAVIVYVIIKKTGVCNGKVLPFGICGDADVAHGKANDIENNSKNKKQDKTPPPTGAAHGREESQSVVSKQDVVIEKRPIPDIPKNNKFRGLSANLDDKNYMTGIDLPAEPKPKNALEPIEPLPKKKKKRKKAKKDAPDSQRTEDEQD